MLRSSNEAALSEPARLIIKCAGEGPAGSSPPQVRDVRVLNESCEESCHFVDDFLTWSTWQAKVYLRVRKLNGKYFFVEHTGNHTE